MKKIYSIGHSNYDVEDLVEMIKRHGINYIIDVRSIPYSKYNSQFDRNKISVALFRKGIAYNYFGNTLGGRRVDDKFFTDGVIDYAIISAEESYRIAIQRLCEMAEQTEATLCLMCSEKNPLECHRFALIGKSLSEHGYEVNHIIDDKTVLTQTQAINILLDKYFPDRFQMSMFENENLSQEQYVELVYKRLNKEMGFKK